MLNHAALRTYDAYSQFLEREVTAAMTDQEKCPRCEKMVAKESLRRHGVAVISMSSRISEAKKWEDHKVCPDCVSEIMSKSLGL